MDEENKYSIHLAVVKIHRDINVPKRTVSRCGGGWWSYDDKTGILRLYDKSVEFGKYDKEHAQEAFDSHRVFYLGEKCFDDFGMKTLQLE